MAVPVVVAAKEGMAVPVEFSVGLEVVVPVLVDSKEGMAVPVELSVACEVAVPMELSVD